MHIAAPYDDVDGLAETVSYGVQMLSESKVLFFYGLEAHAGWDFAARPALLIDRRLDKLASVLKKCFADRDRFPPDRVYLT